MHWVKHKTPSYSEGVLFGRIFLIMQNTSEWLNFFFGGMIGAAAIVLVEHYVLRRLQARDARAAKKQILNGLITEVGHNTQVIQHHCKLLSEAHHRIPILAPLSHIWIDEYLLRCIVFSREEDSILWTRLHNTISLIHQFNDVYKNQQSLSINGAALSGFENRAFENNQSMLKYGQEIKEVSSSILDDLKLLQDTK